MNPHSSNALHLALVDEAAAEPTPESRSASRARAAASALRKLQTVARELYEFELFREAVDLFRYLTLVDPSNASHWYWLGRSLVSVGDPYAAAQVFELGGRLSHVGQFSQLAADAWLRAGYPDRAEAARALTGDPT